MRLRAIRDYRRSDEEGLSRGEIGIASSHVLSDITSEGKSNSILYHSVDLDATMWVCIFTLEKHCRVAYGLMRFGEQR